MAMAFGWTLFVIPFIFVYSPTLLMKGDPLFIIIDSLTAVAGVWFISAAVMGYSLRAMGWIDRLPHAIVGVLLLMPAGAFAAARWLNIAGALMAVALIAWERTMRRSARPQPEPVLQTPISTPQSVAPHVSLDQLGIRNSDGM